MKILQIIILGILILLYSFTNNTITGDEIEVFDFKTPIVHETFKSDLTERETAWLQTANYSPLYIGERKDSIYIPTLLDTKKYFVYEGSRSIYNYPDLSEIILRVDTTRIISNITFMREDDGNYGKKTFKAFPVFIVNKTTDTLLIGYGDHLPLIMEAMNLNGTWQAIEETYMYMCGVGLNGTILPPDEIVVSSAPINKGEFKTKLRLRYNNILSEEFNGTINPTQFERRLDKYR